MPSQPLTPAQAAELLTELRAARAELATVRRLVAELLVACDATEARVDRAIGGGL